MSTPFQNRLVGTIIVAAVAIIFLPDLLDGEKKTYQDNFSAIPKEPKIVFPNNNNDFPKDKLSAIPQQSIVDEDPIDDKITNTAVDKSDVAEQNRDVKTTVKVNTQVKPEKALSKTVKVIDKKNRQTSAVAKKSSTTLANEKLPAKAVKQQAWVIQLGSFRHKENVEMLLKKLKKNGYTAFTKPIKTKHGTLTKVFVGPELIKSSLEKKIPALKVLTKVEGKIARFYPSK